MARDTSTLRDILFDELESLRAGETDAKRATSVAKLAQQIISTAKVEMEFHELSIKARAQGESLVLGSMDLGARAAPVVESATQKTLAASEPPQSTSTE